MPTKAKVFVKELLRAGFVKQKQTGSHLLKKNEVYMRIVSYLALFHCAENDSYWITFPDFKNVFSQGDDFDDAIKMAIDALTLELSSLESEGTSFPKASNAKDISIENDQKLVYVSFDYDEQKKTLRGFKSVKKTLTIPQWLNDAAIQAGINFSAVLQKGLKSELGIKN